MTVDGKPHLNGKPLSMRDDLPPELQKALNRLRDNFVICFVKRSGGKVSIPLAEVDAADDLMTMSQEVDPATGKKVFILQTHSRN